MPTTVVGLEKWLQELWRDKEQALDALYKQGIAQQAARYRILNKDYQCARGFDERINKEPKLSMVSTI